MFSCRRIAVEYSSAACGSRTMEHCLFSTRCKFLPGCHFFGLWFTSSPHLRLQWFPWHGHLIRRSWFPFGLSCDDPHLYEFPLFRWDTRLQNFGRNCSRERYAYSLPHSPKIPVLSSSFCNHSLIKVILFHLCHSCVCTSLSWFHHKVPCIPVILNFQSCIAW